MALLSSAIAGADSRYPGAAKYQVQQTNTGDHGSSPQAGSSSPSGSLPGSGNPGATQLPTGPIVNLKAPDGTKIDWSAMTDWASAVNTGADGVIRSVTVTWDHSQARGGSACWTDYSARRRYCIGSAKNVFVVEHAHLKYTENGKEIFSVDSVTDPSMMQIRGDLQSQLPGPTSHYQFVFDAAYYRLSTFGAPALVTFTERKDTTVSTTQSWNPTAKGPSLPTWVSYFPGIRDHTAWADPFLHYLPIYFGVDGQQSAGGVVLQNFDWPTAAGDAMIAWAFAVYAAGPMGAAVAVLLTAAWHEAEPMIETAVGSDWQFDPPVTPCGNVDGGVPSGGVGSDATEGIVVDVITGAGEGGPTGDIDGLPTLQ